MTPSTAGNVLSRRFSPISRLLRSTSTYSGIVRRQRLDVELARDLLDDAALLDAGRLADEVHGDGGLDRLVEPHLVEVDVRDRAPDRMLLVVLEHRVMRGLLTLDDDVDDPVSPDGPVSAMRSSRSPTTNALFALP